MASAVSQELRDEPGWPDAQLDPEPPARVSFLLDASSGLERRLLEAWIERHRPEADTDFECIEIPPTRRRRPGVSFEKLDASLASGDPMLLAPLRVAWLPRKRDGVRAARFSDLLRLGDPRDPGLLRQHAVLRREPDRCRIVAGEPATADEVRARWRLAGGSGTDETGSSPITLRSSRSLTSPSLMPSRPWSTSRLCSPSLGARRALGISTAENLAPSW